jgi:hypothetical protein
MKEGTYLPTRKPGGTGDGSIGPRTERELASEQIYMNVAEKLSTRAQLGKLRCPAVPGISLSS